MIGRNTARRLLLGLAVPASLLLAGGGPLSATAQVAGLYAGEGTGVATVAFGAGAGPSLATAPNCDISGHISMQMEVSFQVGSASYSGPLDFESDFSQVAGYCGWYLDQIEPWDRPTLSGTSSSGALTCRLDGSHPGAYIVDLTDGFASAAIGDCDLDGTRLGPMWFEVEGSMVPTAVEPDGHVDSAAVVGAVLVHTGSPSA